jgi:hypothetical protein
MTPVALTYPDWFRAPSRLYNGNGRLYDKEK